MTEAKRKPDYQGLQPEHYNRLRKECREGLHYIKKQIILVDDARFEASPPRHDKNISCKDWKAIQLKRISHCLYYFTHDMWPSDMDDRPDKTPMGHFHNRICKKYGGGAMEKVAIISVPRLRPWSRTEKTARDQLNALLFECVTYKEKVQHQPQWNLAWHDPQNDHPDAVKWREGRAKQKAEFEADAKQRKINRKRNEKARIKRIAEEAEERTKLKEQQRKERKKHFEDQERKKKKLEAEAKRQR